MADARSQAAWAQTSTLLALIANAHRDPKRQRPFTPADFDPTRQRVPAEPIPEPDLTILKTVFVNPTRSPIP